MDEDGIVKQATDASNKWKSAEKVEDNGLFELEDKIEDITIQTPENVWYKYDGTTLYLNNSQKDDSYKQVKKSTYYWNENSQTISRIN